MPVAIAKMFGIDDHVLRRETDLVDQDVVGLLADLDAPLERVGLAFFVERHHHHRRAVAARELRVPDELVARLPSC